MADFTVSFDSSDEKERKRRLALVYATILSFPVSDHNEKKISDDENGSPDAGDEDAGLLLSDIASENPTLKGTIHHVNGN